MTLRILTLLVLISVIAHAQYGNIVLQPAPAGQNNAASAALVLAGDIPDPGTVPQAMSFTTATGPTTTVCWTIPGSTPSLGMTNFVLNGEIRGGSNQFFALAAFVDPGSIFCGGFAGWPCATGPYLPSNALTPAGRYHLGSNPLIIFDGIGLGIGSAPIGLLSGSGTFPLAASIPVGIPLNQFPANTNVAHLGFQGLVVDPSSASGLRFTAALTMAQWIFYL